MRIGSNKGSEVEAYTDFIKEAEGLKSTLRTAWTAEGRQESTAEHSWRLALFAGVMCREFPELDSLIIGVDIDRELRREKITRRLKQRLDEGMVDEVRRLIEQGIAPDDLIYYGLEYKYLTLYVIGKLTYEEMFNGLEIAIHQFAKRQMTWFRGMERRGFTIHWMNAELPMEEKIAFVKEKLQGN